MSFIDSFKEKCASAIERSGPGLEKAIENWGVVSEKTVYIWNYIMKFKKLFLCVPVAVLAIILAIRNLFSLPTLVGIALAANGEFSFEMIREVAVLAPLLITGLCILFVFMSKRTLTPWLVSAFSLVLPIWILFINTFPA